MTERDDKVRDLARWVSENHQRMQDAMTQYMAEIARVPEAPDRANVIAEVRQAFVDGLNFAGWFDDAQPKGVLHFGPPKQ